MPTIFQVTYRPSSVNVPQTYMGQQQQQPQMRHPSYQPVQNVYQPVSSRTSQTPPQTQLPSQLHQPARLGAQYERRGQQSLAPVQEHSNARYPVPAGSRNQQQPHTALQQQAIQKSQNVQSYSRPQPRSTSSTTPPHQQTFIRSQPQEQHKQRQLPSNTQSSPAKEGSPFEVSVISYFLLLL